MPGAFNADTFQPESFDPHAPEYTVDPYAFYAWFRDHKPVHFVGVPYNSYWLFNYEDVNQVLSNDDAWVKNSPLGPESPPPTFRVLGNTVPGIFSADNPLHDSVRSRLEPLFLEAIKRVDEYAPIAAAGLVNEFIDRQRVEFIEAFALPLPADVLREVLGVAKQDWLMITKWVDAFVLGNDPTRGIGAMVAAGTSVMALRTFYDALMHGSMRHVIPAEGGLLDMLLAAAEDPDPLSREDRIANAVTLSIAGYVSTTFLIGTGLRHLMAYCEDNSVTTRDIGERVDSDEDFLTSMVWEMLRMEAPFQLVDRFAKEEISIGGQDLNPGDKVTAVVGSANRAIPSDKLSELETFKPDRFIEQWGEIRKVLTFGSGIHRCIGAPLMLKVAAAGFKSLLTKMPPMREAGHPQWQTDPFLRAVSNLPIERV